MVFCLINEEVRRYDLVEIKCMMKHGGLKFDHLKNIRYQKEAVFRFVDNIITDDNVDNDDDGGEVEFEK